MIIITMGKKMRTTTILQLDTHLVIDMSPCTHVEELGYMCLDICICGKNDGCATYVFPHHCTIGRNLSNDDEIRYALGF